MGGSYRDDLKRNLGQLTSRRFGQRVVGLGLPTGNMTSSMILFCGDLMEMSDYLADNSRVPFQLAAVQQQQQRE